MWIPERGISLHLAKPRNSFGKPWSLDSYARVPTRTAAVVF